MYLVKVCLRLEILKEKRKKSENQTKNLMFQSLDTNCCRKARGPPLPGGPPDIGGRRQPRLTEAHQQGRHLQLLNQRRVGIVPDFHHCYVKQFI